MLRVFVGLLAGCPSVCSPCSPDRLTLKSFLQETAFQHLWVSAAKVVRDHSFLGPNLFSSWAQAGQTLASCFFDLAVPQRVHTELRFSEDRPDFSLLAFCQIWIGVLTHRAL